MYLVPKILLSYYWSQGSLETAKQMILAAKTAGADIVKFQKSNLGNNTLYVSFMHKYFLENSVNAKQSNNGCKCCKI